MPPRFVVGAAARPDRESEAVTQRTVPMPTLVIANKLYSSWSLRPWLLLKHTGVAFEEIVIPLDQPNTKAEILKHSPAGKAPILIDGEVTAWESIAIMEYAADAYGVPAWPEDRAARAMAR